MICGDVFISKLRMNLKWGISFAVADFVAMIACIAVMVADGDVTWPALSLGIVWFVLGALQVEWLYNRHKHANAVII